MFCGKCGKKTTEGNLYCIYCGNKLANNNNIENKPEIPISEDEKLKKDASTSTTNNIEAKELPIAWLKFLYVSWFICGIIGVIIYPICILAVGTDTEIISNLTIILYSIIGFTLSILCIVAYDAIDKHKKSGYYLFLILIYSPILWQIISAISASFLPEVDYMDFFVSLIIDLIFDGIWISCNYIYISKRKESYFNIIDNDIIICANCNTKNIINRSNCYMCGKKLDK